MPLDSIRCRTVPPLEVIVCDDGSTNELDDALVPYRDEIILVRKENGGEGSANNAAATVARGEFIAILDAVDVDSPDRLEALDELARLELVELGVGNARLCPLGVVSDGAGG